MAARHAGHGGSISFLKRGLLGRFAADSRRSRIQQKKSPQKKTPLNNFIRSRKRYEQVERDAADLFAHKQKARDDPRESKKKASDTRITGRKSQRKAYFAGSTIL